jgi:hypothetical protein
MRMRQNDQGKTVVLKSSSSNSYLDFKACLKQGSESDLRFAGKETAALYAGMKNGSMSSDIRDILNRSVFDA